MTSPSWPAVFVFACLVARPAPGQSDEQQQFEAALAARDRGALASWSEANPARAFQRPVRELEAWLAGDRADDAVVRFLAESLAEQPTGALLARVVEWSEDDRYLFEVVRDHLRAFAAGDEVLTPQAFDELHAELHELGADALVLKLLGKYAGYLLEAEERPEALALITHVRDVARAHGAHWIEVWTEEWLGRSHWYTGELLTAASHYARAVEIERLIAGGGAYEVDLLIDLATVELGCGRLGRGMQAADEALALARGLDDAGLVLRARAAQASLHLDLGELQTSLAICLALRRDARESPVDLAGGEAGGRLDLLAANVLSDVGRLETAIAFAERALAAAASPELDPEAAESLALEARLTLGLYLGDAGRTEEGLALLDQARAAFVERGDRRGVGWAEKNRGWVLRDAGRLDEALAAFTAGQRVGAELDVPFLEGWCALGRAETLLDFEVVDADAFEAALRVAEGRYQRLLDGHLSWRMAAARGRFAESAQRTREALASYELAVEQIERWRQRLDAPGLLVHFLREKSDPYRRAAFAAAALGEVEVAFGHTELLRARVFSELRATGRPEGFGAGDPGANDAHLHALRLEMSQVESGLRRAELGAPERARLSAQLDRLEEELDLALIDLEVPGPTEASSAQVAARPLHGLAELRERVAASDLDVLVAYLVGERETLAFVARAAGASLEVLPIGERELAAAIARLRAPIEALNTGRLDLANLGFDVRASRELARTLVTPLGLRAGESVGLLLDGPLNALPFEALVVGGTRGPVRLERPFEALETLSFLGDEHALSYLTMTDPGAAWTPPAADDRLVGCAAPAAVGVGSGVRELETLRAVQGALTVETIDDARPSDVLAAAPRAFGLHLVAHGAADPVRPSLSHLVFGGEGRDEEGVARLEAWRIEGLDLARTSLVVLSACHTAEGSWYSGEGLVDLARSFRLAGAKRVVASRWAVDDAATAALMELFYRELVQGARPEEALRTARVALRERRDPRGISLAHPYFFAAWAVER